MAASRNAPSYPRLIKGDNKKVIVAVFQHGDMWLERLHLQDVKYRLIVKSHGRLVCDKLIPTHRSCICIFKTWWHRLKKEEEEICAA